MRMRLLLIVFVTGLSVLPARGTTLVRLSLEQLYQASTEIVQGQVVSQETRWNVDHTRIITLTTITVEDSIKGRPPATLVVEQPGGVLGNIHVKVAGTVGFQPHESYMLFLEPAGPESPTFMLVGMVQGCYRIYRNFETREQRVIPPVQGVLRGAESRANSVRGSLALHEFRERLSTAMNAPVVIPSGTSVPIVIRSTESRGAGRARVMGRTTVDLYPSATVVIPAGSSVEGTARRVAGNWEIHWQEVSIRGIRVEIGASSEELAGGSLRGRAMVVKTR